MRGLWSTHKPNGPRLETSGKTGWANRSGIDSKGVNLSPLFAALPAAIYGNAVLIGDMGMWSGFERPNPIFADRWQAECGLPEVARAAIEKSPRFAGAEVVMGINDPIMHGVMALLRRDGHLTVLCVVDMRPGPDIAMTTDVERARGMTCQYAREYCVEDAILLMHVNARRGGLPLSKVFLPLGIAHADPAVIYASPGADTASLSVGWIASV